jgi:hypothetical protein
LRLSDEILKNAVEQIIKADRVRVARDSPPAKLITTQQNQNPKPAPRCDGLVPPFYSELGNFKINRIPYLAIVQNLACI